MRLARVGKTAVSRGRRNPSRWTMIRFIAITGPVLSISEQSLELCLLNLRLVKPLNVIFPFSTFSTHSLTLFSRSVLQFEIMAFRNLGPAF
jgi:hypothetical protein